jgi:hypothetical protein
MILTMCVSFAPVANAVPSCSNLSPLLEETVTCTYVSGGSLAINVPAGAASIVVDVKGAGGGGGASGSVGGAGARVQGTFATNSDVQISVVIGNGGLAGRGGGYSAIFRTGTPAYTNAIAIAGGGGGAETIIGASGGDGGAAGSPQGGAGYGSFGTGGGGGNGDGIGGGGTAGVIVGSTGTSWDVSMVGAGGNSGNKAEGGFGYGGGGGGGANIVGGTTVVGGGGAGGSYGPSASFSSDGGAAGAPSGPGGVGSITLRFSATPLVQVAQEVPRPLIQQFGLPLSGDCVDGYSTDMNWSNVGIAGWTTSWAHWVNSGQGGAVCTRTLTYSLENNRWIVGTN